MLVLWAWGGLGAAFGGAPSTPSSSLAFTPDGKLLLAAGTTAVWNLRAGTPRRLPQRSNMLDALFPGANQIAGAQVRMGGYNFEIVGVLEKRKAGFFGENEEDNAVYIPFRTAQKVAPAKGYLLMVIKGRSGQVNEALTQAEEILRRRRQVKFGDPNNFDIKTADKFIEQFDSITAMVGLIAIAISSLGPLVGGIGVGRGYIDDGQALWRIAGKA